MKRRRVVPRMARPRAPGHGDVRDRVEAVYAGVDTLNSDQLDLVPPPDLDEHERTTRLDRLEALAAEHGRTDILDGARDRLSDALLQRWVGHLPLRYTAEAVYTGRVEDRAAIITALRDLVAVAVMRDLLDPADADVLAAPGLLVLSVGSFEELDALTRVEDDGDADVGEDAEDGGDDEFPSTARAGPSADGAPSADDWAAAESGPMRVRRTSVRADPLLYVFGGFVALAIVGTLASRLVEGGDLLAGLVVVAVVIAAVAAVLRIRRPA